MIVGANLCGRLAKNKFGSKDLSELIVLYCDPPGGNFAASQIFRPYYCLYN